jgi:hypothetical protein
VLGGRVRHGAIAGGVALLVLGVRAQAASIEAARLQTELDRLAHGTAGRIGACVAVFVSDSPAPAPARAAVIAGVARSAIASYR